MIAESRSITYEWSRDPTGDCDVEWGSSFRELIDHNLPIFRGEYDPEICTQWLIKMRQIFYLGEMTES